MSPAGKGGVREGEREEGVGVGGRGMLVLSSLPLSPAHEGHCRHACRVCDGSPSSRCEVVICTPELSPAVTVGKGAAHSRLLPFCQGSGEELMRPPLPEGLYGERLLEEKGSQDPSPSIPKGS